MAFLRFTKPAIIVAVLISCFESMRAERFLADQGQKLDRKAFGLDLQNAMGSLMGCGGEVSGERLSAINKAMEPMWNTLPKNTMGQVDRRSLRYAVHRYFMQQSSLSIRGFEPSRLTNSSHWGVADILSQQVPAYVEHVLESRTSQQSGFSLDDAVYMVTMLEQLVLDSDRALLEKVYRTSFRPLNMALDRWNLLQILEAYLVNWLVGEDADAVRILLSNQTLLESTLPHWRQLVEFAEGQIRALEFQRQQAALSSKQKRSRDVFSMTYSFDDAVEIVSEITRSFASFWESECRSMKHSLMDMDRHDTGRVPLSKFYGAALDTEWRFGESEEYLREMGALDETSSWRGKQVIIPNYLQAASNCIVSTAHYLVCCANECESLMGEIEVAVGSATVTPSELLTVVSDMTSQTMLDHDAPVQLSHSLKSQLEQIAASHGGVVPIHGRLFAQWLHYVFPRECPFPHKQGVAATVTPMEYGDGYIASQDAMKRHASNATDLPVVAGKEELQWMSQWSPEEELRVDYSAELRAPWEQHHWILLLASGLLILGGISVKHISVSNPLQQPSKRGQASTIHHGCSDFSKAHWV